MKKIFLAFALAMLLLLAGCIQTPNSGKGTGVETQEQVIGGAQGQQEQGAGQQQEAGEEYATGGGQQNYNDMTMGALMNLGVPIKCVITYRYQKEGMSGTALEYIIGKKARIESETTTKDGSTSSIMVVKNEGAYIKIMPEMKADGGMYANCDWLFYPAGENKEYEINEEEKVGADYEKLGYEYTVHCEPAMFGEEKFATPGNVCNIKEMMRNVCADIEDPDLRAQCEQAIQGQ